MKTTRWFGAAVLAAILIAPVGQAQEAAKPGPEHDIFKKMEGTWTFTLKMAGMDAEAKGTNTWKTDLGGLVLNGALEGELFGGKFSGRSLDTYDPTKKKYVGIWVDSMSSSPMMMEGNFDKEKKTLTVEGNGPTPEGPKKYKSVTTMTDDDTIDFAMYVGDGKDPAFTIVYKRKKK